MKASRDDAVRSLASRLRAIETQPMNREHRAEAHLVLALEYEEAGDYRQARTALGVLYACEEREIEGLSEETRAEIYLRAGVLAGWTEGQERAKDLITRARTIYESHRYQKKVAECHLELACCYWREGALSEARASVRIALNLITTEGDLRAKAILRAAVIERADTNPQEAIRILDEAAPLFERIRSNVLKGSYHQTKAGALCQLREVDRALIEMEGACSYFKKANHDNYLARCANNLGCLFYECGRYGEAHTYLDTARAIFSRLGQRTSVADVDDTRARVLLAEGKNKEAERVSRAARLVLSETEERAKYAESLTTHAVALARMGRFAESRETIDRAISEAELVGAKSQAAKSAMVFVEELETASTRELCAYYTKADSLLDAPSVELSTRLRACARRIVGRTQEEAPKDTGSQALPGLVFDYERDLIWRALDRAQGGIMAAARLLGISHSALIYILNNRQKGLIPHRKKKRKSPTKRAAK